MKKQMLITEKDVKFKAVRASGPGGQRTNRRSTKVQLWIKIGNLPLKNIEKRRIREKLAHHINSDDEIEVWSEEERSQEMNRDKALFHLNKLVEEALKVRKPRIPTEPPRQAEEERIFDKKIKSEKKKMRRFG
ncbi:MAG: alternative ribosome rescue aminoacyl-tRNA hydrolase ArfB [Patescibacteria group bacterium]|nr:alternative ribosome rescue aminoacyl-tRNA hydrolase ArfB [Patescibacteria group bacterium]